MTGRHAADKLSRKSPGPGPRPPDRPARVRPYVPLPAPPARQGDLTPAWEHLVEAADFLGAYDAHLAAQARSRVRAYYAWAAGPWEAELAAIRKPDDPWRTT